LHGVIVWLVPFDNVVCGYMGVLHGWPHAQCSF
jgi:hypothetical protein